VYYYICFVNERYIWFYENLTNKKFKATFRFDLTNLRIENEESKDEEGSTDRGTNEWDVYLNPGETCIKTIVRIDPKKESKYKSSYSYSFSAEVD
jgi:hypothetical protein